VPTCDIENTSYNSAYGGGLSNPLNQQGVIDGCDINETPCQRAICKVEGWFVQQILLRIYRDMIFPSLDKFSHMQGFDTNSECITEGLEIKPDKSCCGDYPKRFPYRHLDNDRGCCSGKTFNTDLYKCCQDGSVSIACD